MIPSRTAIVNLLRRPLGRNVFYSVSQTLIGIFCVFATYRIAIGHIGLQGFGVWSLLTATASLGKIGDISGSGSLVRFVARERSFGNGGRTDIYVHSVILTCAATYLFLGTLLIIFSELVLRNQLNATQLMEARILAPYAISAMVLAGVANTILSAIDGFQRTDKRALLVSLVAVLTLLVTAIAVPLWGIKAFAITQILQQTLTIFFGWYILRQISPSIGIFPTKLSWLVVRETTGYGLQVQLATLAGALFEPLSRILLGRSGGLAILVEYELASRLVVQMRSLLIAASQPLIAVFSSISFSEQHKMAALILKTTKVTAWASAITTILTLVAAPILSRVTLGYVGRDFLLITSALMFGWASNTISVPIYYAAFGHGITKWNLLAHVVMAIISGAFGLIVAPILGPWAVVFGVVAGLIGGGLIAAIGNLFAFHESRSIHPVLVIYACGLSGYLALCSTFAVITMHFWALLAKGV